jgi:hypothetical protein
MVAGLGGSDWFSFTQPPADRVIDSPPEGAPVDEMVSWKQLRSRKTLDDRLKELMQELGNAINESLSDSDRIAEAIGEIKQAGYDVFLVLEATIGFNKRDESDDDEGAVLETRLETDFEEEVPTEPVRERHTRRLKWTSQDQKFLKALKIAVDEEPSR